MPLYDDPVQMIQSIRDHVLSRGHRVAPSDNPSCSVMGYQCLDCLAGASGEPVTVTWHVGLIYVRALMGSKLTEGIPLQGVLSSQVQRKRLNDYLNGVGEFAPPKVVRVSRYKRERVI
jgi:hypothetical protein